MRSDSERWKAMQLYLDPEIFFLLVHGGIPAYFTHLVEEYTRDPSLGVSVVGLPRLAKSEPLIAAGLAASAPHPWLNRTIILSALDAPRANSRARSADLVHATYYSRRSLRRRSGQPVATTVHDMTPELFPGHFADGNPHRNKLAHVQEADLILCVSETTRQDLAEMCPNTRGLIVHTPLATGWPFDAPTEALSHAEAPVIGYPYALFVGSRLPYKAFDVLVQALGYVRSRGDDLGLVVVGGGPLTLTERALLDAAGIPPNRFTRLAPSDEQLALLYRSAEVFSYPSDYEGFGLPLLDALASGCVTITSDAPALVEVGGGAALVHPRRSWEALADTIREVIAEPASTTQRRRESGRAHASQFTWARTAQLTAEGYHSVL